MSNSSFDALKISDLSLGDVFYVSAMHESRIWIFCDIDNSHEHIGIGYFSKKNKTGRISLRAKNENLQSLVVTILTENFSNIKWTFT